MASTMIGTVRSDLRKLTEDTEALIRERDELALRLVDKQKEIDVAREEFAANFKVRGDQLVAVRRELDAALERNVTLSADLTTANAELAAMKSRPTQAYVDTLHREYSTVVESLEAILPRETLAGATPGQIADVVRGFAKAFESAIRRIPAPADKPSDAKVSETERVIDERIEKFLVERVCLEVDDDGDLNMVFMRPGGRTFVDSISCRTIVSGAKR